QIRIGSIRRVISYAFNNDCVLAGKQARELVARHMVREWQLPTLPSPRSMPRRGVARPENATRHIGNNDAQGRVGGAKQECEFSAAGGTDHSDALGVHTGTSLQPSKRIAEVFNGNTIQGGRQPRQPEI